MNNFCFPNNSRFTLCTWEQNNIIPLSLLLNHTTKFLNHFLEGTYIYCYFYNVYASEIFKFFMILIILFYISCYSKEAAKNSIVYSYRHGFSGFAAKLTPSQAKNLSGI